MVLAYIGFWIGLRDGRIWIVVAGGAFDLSVHRIIN